MLTGGIPAEVGLFIFNTGRCGDWRESLIEKAKGVRAAKVPCTSVSLFSSWRNEVVALLLGSRDIRGRGRTFTLRIWELLNEESCGRKHRVLAVRSWARDSPAKVDVYLRSSMEAISVITCRVVSDWGWKLVAFDRLLEQRLVR